MPTDLSNWTFRPGTWDEAIVRSCVDGNEYGLPDKLEPDDLVIDIGAHIGGFAHAAWLRGSRDIWCYEPFLSNFDLLVRNLEPHLDSFVLRRRAMWHTDGQMMYSDGAESRENTGGVDFFAMTGSWYARSVNLDDIIGFIGGDIRFLKLDCEGAEFPILLTSNRLSRVQEISLEYHEMGTGREDDPFPDIPEVARIDDRNAYRAEDLIAHLEQQGFKMVRTHRHGTHGTSRLGFLQMRRG